MGTAELPAGTDVGGFRIESLIAHGRSSVVYEATQLDLDRRVALKVFDEGAGGRRDLRSPEHPTVVAVFTAGTSPHGEFVAMQLVRGGRTLADRLRDGSIRAREARTLLGDVAAALDAAHDAGLVLRALSAEKVLLDPDGHALLSGFRQGNPEEAAADRAAFASLVRDCGGRVTAASLPSTAAEITRDVFPARRARYAALVVLGLIGAAVAVVLFAFHDEAQSPPAVLRGAVALGSTLPSSSVESLDCTGRAASGASPACSVAQTVLSGRAVVPRRAGVIRRWTVRGAKGELALQVLRRHGRAYFLVAHTPYADISDGGLHSLPADLPVLPGDLVGLEVAPGAAVGVRRSANGARTARWFGPLVYQVRSPERGAGSGFDHELLLRAEYVPGATRRIDGELRGQAAEAAPAGEVVRRSVVRPGRRPQVLSVARIGERVVVDLANGGRRVFRLTLPDADPAGKPVTIEIRRVRLGLPLVRVSWQSSDTVVTHEYVVGERSLTPLD